MEKLEDIQKSLNEVERKFKENSLAFEMLRELKKSAKRKFIIIIILVVALIGTNLGWLIYNAQFETIEEVETTTVDGGNGVATYLENSKSGDIIYGENN